MLKHVGATQESARTREIPVFAFEVDPNYLQFGSLVGCYLDPVARESVKRFLLKASTKATWTGATLHHWWISSDERQLISAWDWGGSSVQIDESVTGWANSLQELGVLADMNAQRSDGG